MTRNRFFYLNKCSIIKKKRFLFHQEEQFFCVRNAIGSFLSHDFLTILRNHLMHALIRFALCIQMTHGSGFTPNNQRKYFIAQSSLRYINTYTYRRIHCSGVLRAHFTWQNQRFLFRYERERSLILLSSVETVIVIASRSK